ncbi:TlpA family protein disulfide reductase [Mucilaginibacter antarcticus]|uniref:TlpA family protein disulfide reductase n=1 Tax=Mucilaginibacter antarcticus TaxID=1855725 RepID=A0ABW5XN30_9SPHI
MKYIFLFFTAVIAAGCNVNTLNINGTANGVANATFTLKSQGQTLEGVNIKDGKFEIKQIQLEQHDYGTITLSQSGKPDLDFEVYLEPGDYTVTFDKTKLSVYPAVKTDSKIQHQLSAYYKILGDLSWQTAKNVEQYDGAYKQAVDNVNGDWADSVTALSNKAEAERTKLSNIPRLALLAYITKNPDNEISAHLMYSMSFEADPAAYNVVYQKFSSAQKNSAEGADIGQRLNTLVHLSPGAPAPIIEGKTPDGKPFDIKKIGTKLVLIEFWRASSVNSRVNHQTMTQNPPPFMKNKDLGIVSVSFDKKRDWWLGSMRDDKVTWAQVSDLKGNDSPNKTNWAITTTPTYYLLDAEGRIVERDLQFDEITPMAERYLSKH